MDAKILHEREGRMRVRILPNLRGNAAGRAPQAGSGRASRGRASGAAGITLRQADILEAYLKNLRFVSRVKVYERTGDAIIEYGGSRAEICRAIAAFSFQEHDFLCPEHSSRELTHDYMDRLAGMILHRLLSMLLLPLPLRRLQSFKDALPYVGKGLRALFSRRVDVSVLDAVAVAAALLTGDFDTAGSIMFLLGMGDLLEEWTHKKSVADLAGTLSLGVDKVWAISENGQEMLRPLSEVKEQDIIICRMGNMIPVDGKVLSGEAMVNEASITGEPLPVRKAEGAYAYAGTVVEEGEIRVCVDKSSGQGRYDRILAMIEESEKLKSSAEASAYSLADRLVPYSLGGTVLVYLLTRNIARAMAVLMVDYSCALKLAMPLSVLSGMNEAATAGITVKGGIFMENAARADRIVFDKTGTLTHASPRVISVVPFGNYDETDVLRLAACLEEHYPHSMAKAVVEAAEERGIIHEECHAKVEYVVAHGISSSVDGEQAIIGSAHFVFEDEGVEIPKEEKSKFDKIPAEYSKLYLAVGGRLAGVICVEDPVKEGARTVVKRLHALGLRSVMLTGDGKKTAAAVAEKVGVDEFFAEVLPEDKAEFVVRLRQAGHKVIMVGDGINDSPALSEADAGIAVSTGAALATEVADIIVESDDLQSIVVLRELSTALMRRIDSNYKQIMGINSVLILLGVLGVMPASGTALVHNASTVAIGLHSMTRLLK